MQKLQFEKLRGRYAVCRLPADAQIPEWTRGTTFSSVTRTSDELSIVTDLDSVPSSVRAERAFVGFRISGTLDFSQTGVLSEVTARLVENGIPILTVSTFDTDYFFVPEAMFDRARDALLAAGHAFERSPSVPFVKICCISSAVEAELAIELGASALGLVSHMPSGPGVISEELIAAIAGEAADRIETVLLTSETEPDAIADQVSRTGVSGVQLCSWLDDDARKRLRAQLPRKMLMQVVHVVDGEALRKAASAQKHVDRLLLDSGTLSGPIMELGGTGRTHDWAISRAIVECVDIPVLLAGGLHADNVGEAFDKVRPFGLDVCSGVRRDGHLDHQRLAAFLSAVRNGGNGSRSRDGLPAA